MTIILYPATVGSGGGDSSGPLAGSGDAVPGGIESHFTFNGLVMNRRDWWDTYVITKIDGFDDPDVRDSRDQNPGDDGETSYDSFYGGRTITLSGFIRSWNLRKMRDMEVALKNAFADMREHPLYIRSGTTDARQVYIKCKKYQKLVITEEQTNFKYERPFQISLRASDPFFYSIVEHNMTMAEPATAYNALNIGNHSTKARFSLVGPATGMTVTNVTTGESLTVNSTIDLGDVWTIDTRNNTMVDITGANMFQYLDVSADEISLAPGDNYLQFNCTGSSAATEVQVHWNDCSI